MRSSNDTAWQPCSLPEGRVKHPRDESDGGGTSNTIFNYFTKISSIKKKRVVSPLKKNNEIYNGNLRQTYLNLGQKNFGHVKCPTCGMVYSRHQEEEEAQHTRFHQRIVDRLHFPGWKDELIVEEFHDGRIIKLAGDMHSTRLKKLSEIKEVIDAELGFTTPQNSCPESEQQSFVFISSKKVVGCAIVVSISKAYPVLSKTESESVHVDSSSSPPPSVSSWCCSTSHVTAICGISRLWVFSQNRRQKIASRLVDCVRLNFLYGCTVAKEKLAFSDPTPNGRSFAEKYMGESPVLVFS